MGTCVGLCYDNVKDGTESDVDCGGSCSKHCSTGKQCNVAADCYSQVCNGVCQQSTCTDGVKNGGESDVDCGGGSCPKCVTGKSCDGGSDCVSGTCSQNHCL